MSPTNFFSSVPPASQVGRSFEPGKWSGQVASELRHRLVDAQVELLRLYLEKQSTERLVDALDRLIECTEASFQCEEALMECLTGRPDAMHCEAHRGVLAQLENLRAGARNFDRGRLLAHLIMVDREITSHLWDGLEAPDGVVQQVSGERESVLHG